MTLVDFLLSDRARQALVELENRPSDDLVRVVTSLRARFEPDQVTAIIDLHRNRQAAVRKFGELAFGLLYTGEALEQASPLAVSTHRGRRFAGAELCADLGCGIGGDALGLPGVVVGVDLDRLRLDMARHNVGGDRLLPVRADLNRLPAMKVDAAFLDPARRDASGRRIFDPDRYSPPLLPMLQRWLPLVPEMAVKVHPGIDHDRIPESAEAEFVSLDGDMRECTLWFGGLRADAAARATVLPSGATLAGVPGAVGLVESDVRSRLHEPDPAVIRAGLVGDLAAQLGLFGVDSTIAYLTGDADLSSPFLTSYAVESVIPFNAKKIKAHLRSLGVGNLVVKKRGSAVDPETFRRSMSLKGDAERVIVLTRSRGSQVAIVCLP